jgi:hypothetical protein
MQASILKEKKERKKETEIQRIKAGLIKGTLGIREHLSSGKGKAFCCKRAGRTLEASNVPVPHGSEEDARVIYLLFLKLSLLHRHPRNIQWLAPF